MKYLLQNYPGSSVESFEQLSPAEQQAIVDEYLELRKLPGIVSGAQLQPVETATTVRVENGKTLLTDGPFVDAKEHVGGFIVVEVDDLDAALELAARVPPLGWVARSRCGHWWSGRRCSSRSSATSGVVYSPA